MRYLNKLTIGAIAVVVLALIGATVVFHQREYWPPVKIPESAAAIVAEKLADWRKEPFPYELYFQDYKSDGDYLQYGQRQLCSEGVNGVTLDSRGIAMSMVTGHPTYHPVLSAQCGLAAHGRIVRGLNVDAARANMILYANHLIEMQDSRGAFEYPFDFKYYLLAQPLPKGWTSALAQGHALSLLARAFAITKDQKYLDAGRKALAYLLTPIRDGGVMTDMTGIDKSLTSYVFFEEYISEPRNYTLGGYMFTLLGLYDWSHVDPKFSAEQAKAKTYFDRGIKTLIKILPYYDMGGLSAYDLSYITFPGAKPYVNRDYHGVHIYMLHALNSIVDEPILRQFEKKWIGYVSSKESLASTQPR